MAGAHEIVQQRDGDRVRGLFARFKDDTIRVLGGWDPSKIRDDASATIFLADTDARLESITFVMSHLPHPNSEKEPFVQDIIINCGGEIDQPCFKWERLHEVESPPARLVATLAMVLNLLMRRTGSCLVLLPW